MGRGYSIPGKNTTHRTAARMAAAPALFLLLLLPPAGGANAETLSPAAAPPAGVRERLLGGTPQELLVLFDDSGAETEAADLRRSRRLIHDDEEVLAAKTRRFRETRSRVLADLPSGEFATLREYSHLPMAFLRLSTTAALDRLVARPEVAAVYENGILHHDLTQSLPLVKQPQAASLGLTGAGTSVAVIDTGVAYTHSAFGSCTAPGTPVGCRVSASVDIAPDDGSLDDNGHGTNVAGIVAGTASAANIVSLDVFTSGGTSTFDLVISAINWAIANRSAYNIVALNMSLGDGVKYTSACASKSDNPFVTPISGARSAGIIPVASAGNEGYGDGIAKPACTPGVVSVGAVYDANVGSRAWSVCTDSTTTADKVTCFSNSASFLTMLAPGALITAAGSTMAGTSQSSPHVAGAIAALREAFPGETLDGTIARLTSGGVPVTDPRNGITLPRLNLLAAGDPPANDSFSAAQQISGISGAVSGVSWNATKETWEPDHAGVAGGASVWWTWNPTVTGPAAITTHGSSFDTLLAVYTGSSVSGLTTVAANDNDGSSGGTSGVRFTALAGTAYRIAVDGVGGAEGTIALDWSLVPEADLAISQSASPSSVYTGEEVTVTLNVENNGPSTASSVTATAILPENALFVSASSGCTPSGNSVVCSRGDLAAGGSTQASIIVRPQSIGTLTVSGAVSSETTDPLPGNNNSSIDIAVTESPAAIPALSPWGIAAIAVFLGAHLHRRAGRNRRDQV
jgi:uncharacterized repeat protein (TIGR01451 family)